MTEKTNYTIKDTVDSDDIDNFITDAIIQTISENIDNIVTVGYEPSDPSVGIMNDGIFLDHADMKDFYFELDITEQFDEILNSVDFIKGKHNVLFNEPNDDFICSYNYEFNGNLKYSFYKKEIEIEEDLSIDFSFKVISKEYNFKTKKYKTLIEFEKAV